MKNTIESKTATLNIELARFCKSGQLEKVQELINAGADINNTEDPDKGRTPLTIACKYGKIDIAKVLIAAGAKVNLTGRNLETPLTAACAPHERGAEGTLVKILLEAGAEIPPQKENEDSPIHYAAMTGSKEAVQLLIENGISPKLAGKGGNTILHYAVIAHDGLPLVKYLLKAGADVNALSVNEETPLLALITCNDPDPEIALCLIKAGTNLSYAHPIYGNALVWAASYGRKKNVQLLIDQGMNVNDGGTGNKLPILEAMSNDHNEIVKLLFARGADPDSANDGSSLLEYAAKKGDQDFVKAIIKRCKEKADFPENNATLKDVSKKSKTDEEDLENTGKKGNKIKRINEAFIKATRNEDMPMMELLLSEGAGINASADWGSETPLIKAAYNGKMKALRFLLQKKADLSVTDSGGNTALFYAACSGYLEAVKELVKHGADIHAVNNNNWNALMQAVIENHYSVVEYLLELGARTDLIGIERGETAMSLAKFTKNQKIIQLLEKYGAKERTARIRKKDQPYFSILECDYCKYLPKNKELGRGYGMDSIDGLDVIHSETTHPDRHTDLTILIKKCRLCGTYYQQEYSYDNEDSFVAGPSIHQYIQRFNLMRLKIALREHKLISEQEELEKRLPGLLMEMEKILLGSSSKIHPHFFEYFVETVGDYYLMKKDWTSYRNTLLYHPDGKVVLQAAKDLVILYGEYCSDGPYQPFVHFRHILPEEQKIVKGLLKVHKKELYRCLKALEKISKHQKEANKVIDSVKFYKVFDA